MVIKHEIDLAKGAVFGLGQTEPAPYIAQKIGASVK